MADRYAVKLYTYASRNLDNIYSYIAHTVLDERTAEEITSAIEATIFSLAQMPNRGSIRKHGIYADKGYRQLFAKNYIIIYKVYEKIKTVRIQTVFSVRQNK